MPAFTSYFIDMEAAGNAVEGFSIERDKSLFLRPK